MSVCLSLQGSKYAHSDPKSEVGSTWDCFAPSLALHLPSALSFFTAESVDDLFVGLAGITQRCLTVRVSSFAISGERKQINGGLQSISDLQKMRKSVGNSI